MCSAISSGSGRKRKTVSVETPNAWLLCRAGTHLLGNERDAGCGRRKTSLMSSRDLGSVLQSREWSSLDVILEQNWTDCKEVLL